MRGIVSAFAESALLNGDLKIEDFSDKKTMLEKLRKTLPKNDDELFFVINHQDTLLEEARAYSKKKKYNQAYLFYATYFEHFINEILSLWAQKNSINHDVLKSLIKRGSLEDKYTWVLDLLRLPHFSKKHFKIIKSISELRNNYIHYKYKPEPANKPTSSEQKDWQMNSDAIEKAIKYSKTYRSRFVFQGEKKKFKI